jgi:hypothetical protein
VVPLLAIAALVVHSAAVHPWMLDDAFISFRYAENLASGDGPVYNTGEKVEGYTCFLWVVLLALGKSIGCDLVFFSKLLGAIFAVAGILLVANAHRLVPRIDSTASVIAALLLGTCGAFTSWAASGMEVTLFAFLVLLSVLVHASALSMPRGAAWKARLCLLGVICALCALTRPEGLLVSALIFLHQLLTGFKDRNAGVPGMGIRGAGIPGSGVFSAGILCLAVTFVLIYFPYFIWRYSYYGYLLPNTFYAKVGFGIDQVIRGGRYVMLFAGPGLLLLVPILWSVLFSRQWFRSYPGLYLIPFVPAAYVLYVVLVGGDAMPAFRFIAPVVPLLCLACAMSMRLVLKTRNATILLVVFMSLYNIAQMRVHGQIHDHLMSDTVALRGKEVGLWLKEHAPADAVVATNTAGSIPYYSELRTIDMLGMNDVRIAHREVPSIGKGWPGHEKGDGAYVLSRQPDYIILDGSLGSNRPHFPGDREIYENPGFKRWYSFKAYRLDSGRQLSIFERIPSKGQGSSQAAPVAGGSGAS